MFGAQGPLLHGQRAGQQRLGIGVSALAAPQVREVLQADRQRHPRPRRHLPGRHGPPERGLRLRVPALPEVGHPQVVEEGGHGRIRVPGGLRLGQRGLEDPLGLVVAAVLERGHRRGRRHVPHGRFVPRGRRGLGHDTRGEDDQDPDHSLEHRVLRAFS